MSDMPDTGTDTDTNTDARIAALQAELVAVRSELQHFTYAVSHDLRAPLRHIVSYVQLVQEDAGPLLSPDVLEFLATITSSARHMGVLLDRLAALSRVGSVPLQMGPAHLQELVQNQCHALTAQHPHRNVDWRIDGDLPVVLADSALLAQALTQVVGNALKFSAARAPAVIHIHALPDNGDGYVCLQVRDNGVGYNPALQDQLFKVFGRLHSSQQFDGVGLGLILTRKMLERFGGTVSINGVMGEGCTVVLRLPRA